MSCGRKALPRSDFARIVPCQGAVANRSEMMKDKN
jgi:hypothetical protein